MGDWKYNKCKYIDVITYIIWQWQSLIMEIYIGGKIERNLVLFPFLSVPKEVLIQKYIHPYDVAL